MHWLSYMYGNVSSNGNFNGRRWQMRYRSNKVHIVWHLRINMPCGRNCTRCKIIYKSYKKHRLSRAVFYFAEAITRRMFGLYYCFCSKKRSNNFANSVGLVLVFINTLAKVSVDIQRGCILFTGVKRGGI